MRNQFKLSMLFAFAMSLLMLCTGMAQAADYDTDGIDDSVDICVKFYDPLQEDVDGDGIGDACDTDAYGRLINTIPRTYFDPIDVTVDKHGAVYFADYNNNRIRKIESDGSILTLSGTNFYGSGGDGGPASEAWFTQPSSIVVDMVGNVYFTEAYHQIRKIALDGTISTIAGTGISGFSGDLGPARAAQLAFPQGLAVDTAGALYIADTYNHRIRKIANGIISTIVGTGYAGNNGDGGPANAAQLNTPKGVAVDIEGNVYIADTGNSRIRKVALDGDISTLTSLLNQPNDVAVDAQGIVYIADTSNNLIRKVTKDGVLSTIAGILGRSGAWGNGVFATDALLASPKGIAIDSIGNMYIADYDNHQIRKLDPETPIYPSDVDQDYISDTKDNCPSVANTDQLNTDKFHPTNSDLLGDVCDSDDDGDDLNDIAEQYNGTDPLNVDTDEDGLDDKFEVDIGTNPLSDDDFDGDGIKDATDVCILFYDPSQTDVDSDKVGDACDDGTTNPNKLQDSDKDFVADFIDNCDNDKNLDQNDNDADSLGDVCDSDDDDDGLSDEDELIFGSNPFLVDEDADGLNDLVEKNNGTNPLKADTDSDGLDDKFEVDFGTNPLIDDDFDGDGKKDGADNCIFFYNPNQDDTDQDNIGDVCDDGASDPNELIDRDKDFVADFLDNCVDNANTDQLNTDKANVLVTNIPGDDLGDVCDTDDDNDGLTDEQETTLQTNPLLKTDPLKADTDGDGLEDKLELEIGTNPQVDADFDGDTIKDGLDNCILFHNPSQDDTDIDTIGDACDDGVTDPNLLIDTDKDFVADFLDNCDNDNNLDQKNTDGDLQGDVCDVDDDNDGLTDIEEATLNTNPLLADTDGDGLSDAEETKRQTNPSLKTDPLLADTDGDGLTDFEEIKIGTDPLTDADFDGDTIRDALDSCPKFYDPLDVDSDGDGIGDACDTKNKYMQVINTIAGTGVKGFSGDGGNATLAQLYNPSSVAIDSNGNLFIADENNHRIRMVATDGTISTVAGTGTRGFSGDGGDATLAQINSPQGIAIDSADNLFIADYHNHRIRKVATDGTISTVAGTGVQGFSGDGGDATLAQINAPKGIAIDSAGNIFIAEQYNYRIRKVAINGTITTVAGTGTRGFSGDGGDAILAQLSELSDIAVDSVGNLFVADFNNGRIRKVALDGTISSLVGSKVRGDLVDGLVAIMGSAGSALNPYSLSLDSRGNLYFSDYHYIRKVTTNGVIITIAGTGGAGFSGDGGYATLARLNTPSDVTVDSQGNIYIADRNNHSIRKISLIAASLKDSDKDFIADFLDNCLYIANTNQIDTDNDFVGDVCDADDDNDGLTDVQEASYGTNPLVDADLDGDGLSDADEILIYTTNHNNADTDSDGMPDGWEVTNSLDPKVNDTALDADADGYWNIVEYLEGSSPQNDQSVPTSLYAKVTGLNGSSSLELLVDGLPVSLNTNGIQAVPNIPANQAVYNVSLKTHPSNQICIVSNHLAVNNNTEATNAVDIVCRARKLGMEDFGFSYHRYNSLEDTPPVPSVINYVVKVRDQVSNAPVLGLISSDFLVKENGSAISPTESYLTSQPVGKLPYTYKLGVMIDISPSLSLADVADAKQAAIDLVNLSTGLNGRLKDNIQMAIWTFDGDVYSNQSYTDDAQLLITAVSSVQRSLDPSTNLNEAIKTGLESWFNNYDLNNLAFGSLIVITDGGDTSGVFSSAQVAALRGDKTIYALPVGAEASNSANIAALKQITGEVNNPNAEQKRIFPTANFAQLSAQLNSVVQQGARFFEGLYAIYYSSPKRANTHIASLSINQNTLCVPSASLACEISYEFDATEFGAVMPELVGNWPKEFLSSNSLALQVETRWSVDPANYTWTVLSADTGMSLTVDANDSSKVIITADPTSDETAITFEVEDNNYTGLPSLTYTVTATDGVASNVDVCPSVFDPLQEDTDGDGVGDACQGSNIQAFLDIDGSQQVDPYDLLMIQRYVGGVSSLTNNIQLPTNVGGSGPNGEMTNIELRDRISLLLANVSLDVDGDGDTDPYDLLMIQRYIGSVSNLTNNIQLPISVGGSGAQGERTNTELRQAVFNIVGY